MLSIVGYFCDQLQVRRTVAEALGAVGSSAVVVGGVAGIARSLLQQMHGLFALHVPALLWWLVVHRVRGLPVVVVRWFGRL